MQQGTQALIRVVNDLRTLAKQFPAAAPIIAQINQLITEVQRKLFTQAEPGEPSAPPMNG